MKHFSTKRAKIERQYRKVQREILEEREHYCAGCGKTGRLSFSHRIPRIRRTDLIADKNNLDLMCLECHELVELGRYDELENGVEIQEYIREVDEEYFLIKTL